MKNIGILLLLIANTWQILAQQTGRIEYKELGIAFSVPEGWLGQVSGEYFIMGSNSIPGLILVTTHTSQTIQELDKEIRAGVTEENNTYFSLQGDVDNLGENALGGAYSGLLEGQSAKAYVVGLINPYGQGISIIAVTTTELYSDNYKSLAIDLKNSVAFSKVVVSDEIKEWKEWFKNVKLTYMESYSSPSYTDGGISGGYSNNEEIDLCAQGYFNLSGNSSLNAGGNYSSAYSQSGTRGSGEWSVAANAQGKPLLILKFHSGETRQHLLEYKDNKLYMDGYRYFRTTEGEYAPVCD